MPPGTGEQLAANVQAETGNSLAMGIAPGWEGSQSTDAEKRRELYRIINTPGYDPATVRDAQRMWIQMQKSQVRGA